MHKGTKKIPPHFCRKILSQSSILLPAISEPYKLLSHELSDHKILLLSDTMLHHFKLKNTSESIEDKIRRLSDEKFVSNFNIKVGRY